MKKHIRERIEGTYERSNYKDAFWQIVEYHKELIIENSFQFASAFVTPHHEPKDIPKILKWACENGYAEKNEYGQYKITVKAER